jgi:hypothetical protein
MTFLGAIERMERAMAYATVVAPVSDSTTRPMRVTVSTYDSSSLYAVSTTIVALCGGAAAMP